MLGRDGGFDDGGFDEDGDMASGWFMKHADKPANKPNQIPILPIAFSFPNK